MSSSEMPFFAAALLYSNQLPENSEETRWLSEIQRVIKSDPILKRSIRPIRVDNFFSRDLLTHNTSGVKVTHCPVFAIKYFTKTKPTLYPIAQVNEVFSEVYQAYYAMFAQRQTKPTQPPQINLDVPLPSSSSSCLASSELEDPAQTESSFDWGDYANRSLHSPESSRSSRSERSDQKERSEGSSCSEDSESSEYSERSESKERSERKERSKHSEPKERSEQKNRKEQSERSEHSVRKKQKDQSRTYQQKKGSIESMSDHPKVCQDQSFPKMSEDGSTQVIISWNLDSFHPDGQGRQIWVQPGDHLTIRSNDSFQHSIILTDAYWKMIQSQLHPTSHNLNIVIPIKFQPGHYYLMDGCYPDRIRLKLTVQSPSDIPQMFNLSRDRTGTMMQVHPNIYTFKTKPCHPSFKEPSSLPERSFQRSFKEGSFKQRSFQEESCQDELSKEDRLDEFDLSEDDSDWSPETNEF